MATAHSARRENGIMAYVVDVELTRVPAERPLSPRAQGGQCLFRPAGEAGTDSDSLRVVYPPVARTSERWTRIY
ncbi:hypothetical protein [Sphingomonas sp.]|uniref:hypothetical protein n=1 Tax=Sphingomonas sp. TaxID=28214 RepID=UPI00289B18C3|nr:hypothetical protein [Sphingomonas sp.]